MSGPLVVAVVGAAAAVALAVLIAWRRSQRVVWRRIDEVATGLEGGVGAAVPGHGLDAALTYLERAAEAGAARLDEASDAASRLVGALEAIPQGVVVRDPGGREVFRNAVAVAYAGGRHADAVVEQAIQEQLVALAAGACPRRTLDLYGPPRRVLLISALALPALPDAAHDGRGHGAVVVVDDVSERRRLEAVRRDFVANISHELKTPVGALGLLADTIAAEEDAAVIRRLAQRMTGEAFRVGRMIDDLLDLSRIEAEEAPRREAVPVHLVVAEAVTRVRPLAQARGIVLDVDELAHWHTVRGDQRQLVSAVANLLDNACKYSDEGSSVELRSWVDGQEVEIEVRDHGIGIPGRDLERVFERFYRVDRARSRGTGGTGLGLAIVRHVATNHQGEVRVASREGEGSVFTLRLPAGHAPARSTLAAAP